ncbi:MAG: autoinducer binding domain-containing protein [Gammaproteobacteria bacterium]|nr:autoinducer binding domain-containing protein [Gammaproteobacteria bacterium]
MTPWLEQPWVRTGGLRQGVLRGLGRMARDLGVGHFSFVLARPAGGLAHGGGHPSALLSNFPPAWLDCHSEDEYRRVDPVPQLAMRRGRPFFLEWERFPRFLPQAQRRFLVEAGNHGLRNWLVIPVQGPLGSFGVLCLVDGDAARLRDAVRGEYGRLWAVALDVHGFLLREDAGPDPLPALTEGERICLALALEGHSAERMAAATGWSRSTANHHVSKAQRKLGCGNRFEAAVCAMRLGLL